MVRRTPRKNEAMGTRRRPAVPAITASASSARSGGAMSADGAALQRLPPSVARLRTWIDPTIAALSASEGKRDRTRASSSSSRAVTEAPTRRPPPSASCTVRNSATPERSTTQPGLSRPFLSWGRRSVPPATTFVSGPRRARISRHSSTLPGKASSNRRTRSLPNEGWWSRLRKTIPQIAEPDDICFRKHKQQGGARPLTVLLAPCMLRQAYVTRHGGATMLTRLLLALLLALAAPGPAPAQSNTVILSTTTSTQDSGLLDVLVPIFEKQTGLSVKTISVGTGQALALAARGEADVTLAHAPSVEKKYVDEGRMLNRRLVMYNDFVIIGPEADPARIRGEKSAVAALKRIAETQARFVSR